MDYQGSLSKMQDNFCGKGRGFSFSIDIEPGVTARAGEILQKAGMPRELFLVGDENTFGAAKGLEDTLTAAGFSLNKKVYPNLNVARISTGKALAEEIAQTPARGILAVGTGTVIDTSRIAAFTLGFPYAVYGTAPSMDGFASSSASMIHEGYKRTYYVDPPKAVMGDVDVLDAAPAELLASGMGDVLGKYVALADWQIANLLTGECYCGDMDAVVRDAADEMVRLAPDVLKHTPGVGGGIMKGLMLPGIAMSFCGTSRPASGAEHYLAHCWEILAVRDGREPCPHGRKVGVAAILMADMYHRLAEIDGMQFKRTRRDPAEIEAFYGSIYPEIAKELAEDVTNDMAVERVASIWPQVREILRAMPSAEVIAGALKTAGGAVAPEDVHVGAELARQTLIMSRYARNRLTLYKLFDFLDVDDDFCLISLDRLPEILGE